MDLCCQCRRGVSPITIHRADLVPLWQRLLDAPKYPLGAVGLLSLVSLAFVRALTSYVSPMSMLTMGAAVFLLRQGLYWAFLFFIIRNSAEGASKMGVLGFRDIQSDVVSPALKGLLATALLWLPAAIYVAVVSENGVFGILTYEGSKDPFFWALALVGILYAPMALLAGATDLGFLHILNPIQIFSSIRRMGRDYFVAIAAMAVVLIFGRILDSVAGLVLAKVGIPFLPRWLAEMVSLYPTFIAARVLGTLLFARGEALDWGRAEEYQVPVLAGVRPRGVIADKPQGREKKTPVPVPAPAPAPAKQLPRSIPVFDPQVGELSSDDEAAAAQSEPRLELDTPPSRDAHGFAQAPNLPPVAPPPAPPHTPADRTIRGFSPAAASAPGPPARPPAPNGPVALLLRAVDEGRMDEALRIYRELPGQDATIPPRVHVLVGREAYRVRDFDVAIYAFRQVTSAQNEHEGAALVSLGQVLGDGLRDVVGAEKVYREAMSRFPGTEVATFAERKIAALKGAGFP
jgi:hypothetical protein